MKLDYCSGCNQFQVDPHKCPCKSFTCWYGEVDDSIGESVFAFNGAEAAEKYAKQWFCSDIEPATIFVKVGNEIMEYEVYPMMEVYFSAIEVGIHVEEEY